MASRTCSLLFLVIASAIIGLAACGEGAGSGSSTSAGSPSPSSHSSGSLSYSLAPISGGLSYEVRDTRPGSHTVWVVLLNPPKGTNGEWLALKTGSPDTQYGGAESVPAGTYRYAVYSVDVHVDGPGDAYWTVEHLVGKGTVKVL